MHRPVPALGVLACAAPVFAQASLTGIGLLPGAGYSTASGISGNGSVVVGESGPIGAPHALRWTVGTGPVDLGVLSGQTTSSAKAVSADGTVVVGASGSRAFRWTAGSGITDLGLPGGATGAEADGLSGNGLVAVGYATSPWATPRARTASLLRGLWLEETALSDQSDSGEH